MSKVEMLLVGAGGYGAGYFSRLWNNAECGIVIKGIVDPLVKSSRVYSEIEQSGIPLYDTIAEFFADNTAELAVIATPIHLHYRHAKECISHGLYVLLEKPICASSAEAGDLMAAEREHGRFIAIGYQLNYALDVLKVKRDILDGKYGKPLRFSTLNANTRGSRYYARNSWTGRITTSSGEPVFDSPVHNANSHQLHLMYYLMGEELDTSLTPVSVEAELYRANKNLENFDTAALKCSMPGGAQVFYFTTHATPVTTGHIARFELEKGTVYCGGERGQGFLGVFNSGETVNYSEGIEGDFLKKLLDCAAAMKGGERPPCTVKTALPELLTVEALQSVYDATCHLGEEHLEYAEQDGQTYCYIKDVDRIFRECYEKNILPHQTGAPWARASRKAPVAR